MKKLQKLITIIFSLILVFVGGFLFSENNNNFTLIPEVSAAEIVKSGSCGTNVTYTLDSEGTLTISGTGAMTSYYYYSSSPWYSSQESIKKVIISDGVTSIGEYAFYNCSSLQSVTIPDSVTSIGEYAFCNCSSLQNITIPDSVTSIGNYAFYKCSSLQSVTIPDSITSIGSSAFYECSNLQSVTIPDSVTSIGSETFRGCSSLQSVTIGNSVTSIGEYAFCNCSSLQNVTIPDSVTSIGSAAFYNCRSLQNITIPDSVTSIGDRAFYECRSLQSVTIGNSVTSIGSAAFYNCSSLQNVYIEDLTKWFAIDFKDSYSNPLYNTADLYLNGEKVTDVTFPAGTTAIGKQLSGCTSLVNVTIPDSVTSIGSSAFSSCSSLQSVTIPDSVTSIGGSAFYNCSSLQSVTIPDSVTSIGSGAFEYCSSLQRVIIGNGVTSIGYGAFSSCRSLQNITIPDSVTSIGRYAFSYSHSLQNITIPDSVTSIGDYAFCGCSSLQSVTIPDSVTSIGIDAFEYCSSLQNVYIEDLTKWFAIDFKDSYSNPLYNTADLYLNGEKVTDFTFPAGTTEIGTQLRGCTSLVRVTIPDSVTSIGDYAFYGCSSLQSVTIPDSVTSIGKYAFCECSSLQNVTIPDSVTSIGEYAFYKCSSLQRVIIGNGVTSIGEYAFYGCSSLQRVIIGNGVTSIGYHAFESCSSLQSVTIGNGVTSIGYKAFYECSSLQSVTIPDSVTSIGIDAFEYCSSLQRVIIGNGVTSIGEYAFYSCSSLSCVIFNGTSEQWGNISIGSYNYSLTTAKRYCLGDGYVADGNNVLNQSKTLLIYNYSPEKIYTIPSGIKSIERNAFSDSKNLSAVILPEGLKNIGSYAFSGGNLSSIYIPVSVSTIDQYAFNNCSRLSDVYFGGTEEQFKSITIGNYNTYLKNATIHYNTTLIELDGAVYTEDMKTLVAVSNQKEGAFTVPATVTTINTYAFSDCGKITEILIPETVTVIGNSAFRNCDGISEITLPVGITKLNNYVLYDCDNLQSITIPDNVTSIGEYAFYGCENLKTVSFNSALLSVGSYAFYGCKELQKLSLPEKLTAIGNYAFSGCSKLSEIFFPSSLTAIGSYAFSENSALTYVSLPDFVNSLGTYVFYKCMNLEKICLPEGTLASIPANAFNGCQKLTSIFIPEYITAFGDSAFYGCNNLSDIYYGDTEAEWDKISIVSSNSVIWAATVHFEHSHTNSKWQTIFEPEAHTTGLKSSICDVCSYERREAIPVIHTEVSEDTVASTCSAVGYTAGVYCNDCKAYISGHEEIAIDADAHKWDNGTITTTATCKVNGVKAYTCEYNSKHTYTEDLGLDASNHVNTINTDAIAPTCSAVGYTAGVYCNDCERYISGHEEIAIDADAHMWDNGTITTIATCKVSGVKTHICQHDATHKKTENLGVNASNHINTKNTEAVASTCSTVGYTAGVYCNDCQKYISGHTEIGIDVNAHKWDNGSITTTATCKISGVKTYTCQHNSAHTKTESLGVNVSNHVNTKNVAEVKATCTTKGYTAGVYCNDCEKYISGHTEIGIDVNAHKWDNGTITTVATCKVSGVKTYTCQHNASHKKTEDLGINASNHVNTKNVAEVKATCTTKGYTAGVYCNDCQKYISGHAEIAINPANHMNTKKVPETPATFENVGYTAGVYCNDCKKYISGHVEIPKLVPEFTDSKDAKESGNNIVSNNGLTVAQLLSQAGKGAVIKTTDGKSVENAALIGTGMVLTMADGSKKEIVVYGDVDGDGKISAADARLALRTSVGLEKYSEDSCYYKAANVESKDKLSAADARLILRASVGLEDPKSWMK